MTQEEIRAKLIASVNLEAIIKLKNDKNYLIVTFLDNPDDSMQNFNYLYYYLVKKGNPEDVKEKTKENENYRGKPFIATTYGEIEEIYIERDKEFKELKRKIITPPIF